MTRRTALATFVLASLLSAGASAAPKFNTLITFETFPGADGVLNTDDDQPASNEYISGLTDQYASLGLTFSQGSLFNAAFYDGNPANHFISSTNPVGHFSVPVFGIRVESHSFWNATLSAFDQNGQLIASSTLYHPAEGTGIFAGIFGVSTTQQIYSFSILPDEPKQILNLDNLALDIRAAAPVPEPSQYLMFGAGAALLAGLRRRSKR